MPRISIITPAFNVEDYLPEAIRSLQAQTFRDFEAIIVDDGSTDATVEAARAAIAGDTRFKVVRQGNAGPASARNRGLAEACGDYIAFLDADDLFEPNALQVLNDHATRNDLDYLDFSAHTTYEDARLRTVRDESFYEGRRDISGVMNGRELFCTFQRNREYCCAVWLHFFKRTLAKDAGLTFREGMYVHEDELFSPLLVAHAERAAFLNEPLYHRRVRASSAMTSGRGLRNVSSLFEVACELRAWLERHVNECDAAFVGALAQRIAELHELACIDAATVTPDDLMAYGCSLPPARRIEFEVAIVQGMLRRDEFYGSTTWRVGEALLAAPNALRKLL